MGKAELIKQLEEIPCTLNKEHKFELYKVLKNGNYKLKCPECAKKGLSNIITVEVKPNSSHD